MIYLAILAGAVALLIFSRNQTCQPCQGAPVEDVKGPCRKLSAGEIAQLAQNAGFQGDDLQIAVAVCLAESHGNPNAYNPEKDAHAPEGLGSYGLFQIFLYKHPEFRHVNLYDPQTNANAAFSVYSARGSSFEPWATFDPRDCSRPKYLAFMTQASNGIASLAPGPTCGGDPNLPCVVGGEG